ncbi:MAG: hypothetical protein US74_C0006G0013 [Parcubacteria group bacterium GW2011_GWA2_38_13]|nr:MAG: hypothetical protein US74_C0006G0013 [Parcubacteria group bacterium GW2011_GWA2_38_13]
MKRRLLLFFGFLFFVAMIPTAHASIQLVKSKNSPAVYFLNGDKSRHAFPNFITYKSWYGDDFSKIVTMSDEFISQVPLGKNVTIRPGTHLIKVPSNPSVYAVEEGGVLRHIDDYAVAMDIYGKNWEKKIVDIPEVFFENYTIGDSIKNSYDIPDSIIYKINSEPGYYWKTDNIIRPFENIEAILKNGYSLNDVVYGNALYYSRKRPITGVDDNINNIFLRPKTRNYDCENKKLKAGFIFLSNASSPSYEEVEKIQYVQEAFPQYFSWATNKLSSIDTAYPVATLKEDGYFINKNDKVANLALDEIAQTFYETRPDIFDFLVIFGDFKINNDEQAHFTQVSSRVEGIGMNMLEADEIYGSQGKLKGIIVMNNINDYDFSDPRGSTRVMNILLHEMLHQWSGSIQFKNEKGEMDSSLLRKPDELHWSFYAGFISPLGGSGWQENKNGTFTSLTSLMDNSQEKPFAALDMYLMGLLPYQVIAPVYYIVPDDPKIAGNTISAKIQTVTIEQIIDANGYWKCNL